MKKLLLTILACLLPTLVSAQCVEDNLPEPVELARLNVTVLGGGVAEEPSGDCDWSSADTAWNGEHSSGNTFTCEADDSTTEGTLMGSDCPTTCATFATDPGVLTGTFVLLNADQDRFCWDVTSSEFEASQGYIHAQVSAPNCTGDTHIVSAYNGSYRVLLYLNTDNKVYAQHYKTSYVSILSTDTVPTDGTLTDVYMAWDVNGSLHGQAAGVEVGVCVGSNCGTPGSGSWLYDSDADDAVDFTDPTSVCIGSAAAGHADDIYVTNVEFYNTTTP